jgi:glycerate kinase
MKIVIAPDSFKASLSAIDGAGALAEGILQVEGDWDLVMVPLADGGEGTLEALQSQGFTMAPYAVVDAHGAPITATMAVANTVAVIESAKACAFDPGASAKDAMRASSAGVGMLIRHAMDAGVEEILLAVGGTATSDGGVGMLRELGAQFLDAKGRDIGPGGAGLRDLDRVDLSALDPRIATTRIRLLADVENPFLGPTGAAAVFAPQKGVNPADVKELEKSFAHLATLVGPASAEIPGSGAGGGLGFAALAVLGATTESGATAIMELVGLEKELASADVVITGEGSFDDQSLHGKLTGTVLALATKHSVPSVVVCGVESLSNWDVLKDLSVVSVVPLSDQEPNQKKSMARAKELMVAAGRRLGQFLSVSEDPGFLSRVLSMQQGKAGTIAPPPEDYLLPLDSESDPTHHGDIH